MVKQDRNRRKALKSGAPGETKQSLKPDETVFIDDTVENIDKAVSMGWRGIVWHDRSQVEQELRALGVQW